jgi:hypothetical protein
MYDADTSLFFCIYVFPPSPRTPAATVFLASIVATIFFALRGVHILVFVFMTVQWLALVWYCLSYIPGAQTLCWTTVSACLGL